MIKDISLSNFKAFLSPQKFSLRAQKSDRLQGNYLMAGRTLLYKSAAIFSGNNVGKTSFLEAVFLLKKALLAEDIAPYADQNVYAKNAVIKMEVSFSLDGKSHVYSFAYDASRKQFLYERFDGTESTSSSLANDFRRPFLEQGRLLEVLFMDDLPNHPKDDALSCLLLSSLGLGIDKGHEDLSSLGTRRAAALVPHVVDALVEGKSLFIDEFDSGLSFVLTRAIVSLFNNIDNPGAQLVFASHDITLLDTKRLFLLPQIKLISKKGHGSVILSLEKLVREGEDPLELFLRGKLGSINRAGLAKFLVELNRRRNRG